MALTDDLIKNLELRPKCYIELYSSQANITAETIRTGQVLTEIAKYKLNPLGAVQTLTINSERRTNAWRELDYHTAGRPVETYPGLTSYTLDLDRVVLYAGLLGNELKFSDDSDIIKQNRPLLIQVNMWAPDEISQYVRTWYIYGVWFKSNPIEFDATAADDIKIVQHITATATGIIASAT